MAKRTITSKSQSTTAGAEVVPLTAAHKSQTLTAGAEAEKEVNSFELTHDEEAGTVSFSLVDGTPVILRSPKPKDFLLVNSFMKQAEPEYLTEEMLGFKLITLCMSKLGNQTKVDFYQFLDQVEDIEDFQRIGEAFNFFRDQLERLTSKLKKQTNS